MSTIPSSSTPNNNVELAQLVGALVDEQLTDAGYERLLALLRDDPAACDYYLDYMELHARLEWRNAQNDECGEGNVDECRMMNDELPNRSVPTSVVPIPSFSVQHSAFTGVLFSYAVAALILGAALTIASVWKLSDKASLARAPFEPTVESQDASVPRHEFVGRITALVDCRWTDPETAVVGPTAVPLGRRYALASGLMEITYDTGAKVVLQGPCSYQVDSAAGGFLSVGKLVARVEMKEERRTKNGELSDSHSLFLIPHSYFAIKTPTAVITDLGTEFGVDVDDRGGCEVHVLEGLVEAKFLDRAGKVAQSVELREGEARRYHGATGQLAAITADRKTFEPIRAVRQSDRRQQWLAFSRKLRSDPALVAYYTFEPHGGGPSVLPNQSALGDVLDARVEGAEWVGGRWPGKFALYFHGPRSGDIVTLPEQGRFNFAGPFSAAVWFKVEAFTIQHQPLVAKGDDSWRLQECDLGTELRFATNTAGGDINRTDGRANVADGRWHLAVAVFEPAGNTAHQRLYVDGRLDAETIAPLPLNHNAESVSLGSIARYGDRTFHGLIDEAAIFSRCLSNEEIETMFAIGSPTVHSDQGIEKK